VDQVSVADSEDLDDVEGSVDGDSVDEYDTGRDYEDEADVEVKDVERPVSTRTSSQGVVSVSGGKAKRKSRGNNYMNNSNNSVGS